MTINKIYFLKNMLNLQQLLSDKINKEKDEQMKSYHKHLLTIIPNITFEQSVKIYNDTISIRQSTVSNMGKIFESMIEELFKQYGIKYHSQVSIDLINQRIRPGKQRPVVDFVIGESENLKDLIIVSCKYTCRERASEDDWTLTHKPKKYFLVVATDDYPSSFKDTHERKLFTLKSKKAQQRLTIEQMLAELSPVKRYSFIDLCCGIGSFHYSMSNRGTCVMACDILPFAKNTYYSNYGIECMDDLTKIDYTKINADIVFSGNPCQSFSNIGQHKGLDDQRGDLFNFIIDNIMSLQKYKVFVFENVDGLLSHNDGKTLKYLLNKIKLLKYNVLYKVLLCSDYGIPQNRKRVFIICFRQELKHDEEWFETILNDNYDDSVCLTEYMNNGLNFQKSVAYTIRCGGFHSPLDSKQNWDGYLLQDGSEYRLSIDDMKHLQGFPKDFKLIGTKTEQQKLLGNTIPTNLTKIICDYVVDMLDMKRDYIVNLKESLKKGEITKTEYDELFEHEHLSEY